MLAGALHALTELDEGAIARAVQQQQGSRANLGDAIRAAIHHRRVTRLAQRP